MKKRIRLTEAEANFILSCIESQRTHALSDPHRGVLTVEALDKLAKKIEENHDEDAR